MQRGSAKLSLQFNIVRKIILSMVIFLFLFSCSEPSKFSGAWTWGGSIRYPSEKNDTFINKLKENNIQFHIESDKMVTYRLRDLAKVRIVQDFIEGRDKEQPVFGQTYIHSYPEEEFALRFKKKANNLGIRVEPQGSPPEYILWEFKDRQSMYEIEQQVITEINQKLHSELKSTQ
jgi:hypothetical protein